MSSKPQKARRGWLKNGNPPGDGHLRLKGGQVAMVRASSEHQFQPKLNLARTRGCARDFTRRGTDSVARKDERVRKIEVRPVSDVKKFGPKQHSRPFRNWDGLEDREIDFRQARPIQHSPAQVSPSA